MSFQEITIDLDGEDMMLDIDTKTGKVIDLYVFNDFQFEYYSERKDDYVELVTNSWKSSGNPLFIHCPNNRIKKTLELLQYSMVFHSDDLEEYFDLINKMISVYNLNVNTSY